MIRLSKSLVDKKKSWAVSNVIDDGYNGMGKQTTLFEQVLASYIAVNPQSDWLKTSKNIEL